MIGSMSGVPQINGGPRLQPMSQPQDGMMHTMTQPPAVSALSAPFGSMQDWRQARPEFQFDQSLGTGRHDQRMDWREALMGWRGQKPGHMGGGNMGGQPNPQPVPSPQQQGNYQLPLNPYGIYG